jgi:hypothetical protein
MTSNNCIRTKSKYFLISLLQLLTSVVLKVYGLVVNQTLFWRVISYGTQRNVVCWKSTDVSGNIWPHLQGRRINQAKNQNEARYSKRSGWLSTDCTALFTRRYGIILRNYRSENLKPYNLLFSMFGMKSCKNVPVSIPVTPWIFLGKKCFSNKCCG